MKTEKSKKQISILMRGTILNLLILVTGILAVVAVLFMVQRQYSIRQTQDALAHSLETVRDILNTNTRESDALTIRVHRDNQAIANDLAEILLSPGYVPLFGSDPEDRTADLAVLSETAGGNNEVLVVGKDGLIRYASSPQRVGLHLVGDGLLTTEQCEKLQRTYSLDGMNYNGTYVESCDETGSVQMSSDPVRGRFGADGREAFFYSKVGNGTDTLILETYTDTLNTLMAKIGDIGTALSGVVMENNGFLFAVNADGMLVYFDDGQEVLTGKTIADCGLTEEILKEPYSGLLRICGSDYQCRSGVYSSSLYGDGIILFAAMPDRFVSREIFITSLFTILVFAGIAVLILIYTLFLKTDPEQIVGYDEKILREKGRRRRKAIRNDRTIRNVEAFRGFGRQYYYKVGVAKRIAPVILLGLVFILLVSWNSQRLTMLTKNMISADSSMMQLESLFENSSGNSELLTAAYEQHYLSKIKLISYLIEIDPEALNGKTDGFPGENTVNTYLDDKFNPMLDTDGRPIRSVSHSTALKRYEKQNGIDEIYIFDDHGHIIASGNDIWKFTLSTDPQEQSYAFRKILTGEAADLIQEPMVNDVGNARQYMGTAFYYFTLRGDGEADGRYVSKAVYDAYTADGVFIYEDKPYEVICRRGMIQAGISDERIDRILESTSPSYLIQQFEVGEDGYAMIFDHTEEHVCLWSPVKSDIGKTAKALGVSENGFSGYYKGFCKIDGMKYVRYIRFDNSFWVALNIPQAAVFSGEMKAAVLSVVISAVFYLILFFFCTVSSEDEEQVLEALLEDMIEKEEDNSMFKVTMPNGKSKYVRSASAKYHSRNISWSSMTADQKMSRVIRVIAILLGLIVIAVTVFEQKIFGPISSVHYILTGSWDRGLNYFACFYCVIMLICTLVCASAISLFVSFIVQNMGKRVETIGRLLLSVIKYGSVLFGVFYSMSVLGISTSGVVTSAGIFSVVVGLGAQSLISDILSGIFIIFEGSFRVGDIVEISGFCGYVREIGIRTTLVEDYLGDIKIFNNSQISGILNHTKKDSYVLCKVGISYKEDIERVEKVVLANLPKIKHKIPGLIGELRYSGVMKLDDSAVVIGIGGRCHEGEKRFFTRRLLREILILFRDNKIEIPFPQLTISTDKDSSDEKKHPDQNREDPIQNLHFEEWEG